MTAGYNIAMRDGANVGLVVIVCVMGASACGEKRACLYVVDAGKYRITVTDADTGVPICDAKVAVNGAEVASIKDCEYWGTVPGGPSATISATHPAYVPTETTAPTEVWRDDCGGAIPTSVKMVMQPL